jgi:hypothetical protein
VSHQTLRALFEIRLRWTDKEQQQGPSRVVGGLWVPDTPRNRERGFNRLQRWETDFMATKLTGSKDAKRDQARRRSSCDR